MTTSKLTAVKQFVRNPYAWPGGYPIFAVCQDGGCLCHACTQANFKLVARSTMSDERDGWNVAGVEVNYEDNDLHCDHCSKPIESAYGND